ncbi:unnamed protein product [Onchocerca flexuosa]|uniref:Uncharacterized protein n=1 Tax=Onchocerca flexuosa TaxID=387005 RepID=A0A183HIL5_9BILA|nr:unnamed protein product [Onchocerca flexuosa]
MSNIANGNNDLCHEYSNEYGHETERWNQLSSAALPTRTLLRLLHEEILSVHRQFETKTHGLLIGSIYMHDEYEWKDSISVVHPSVEDLIARTNTNEECYRFMLFQCNPILKFSSLRGIN